MKRIFFKSSVIVLNLLISACGHNNPLLKDETISHMRGMFMLEDANTYPIRECSNFYANSRGDSALKDKCNQWSEKTFDTLSTNSSLPSQATLDNFRDPTFWQRIIAVNK